MHRHITRAQIAAKLSEFLAVRGETLPEDCDEWRAGLLLLAADLSATTDEAALATMTGLDPAWIAPRAIRLRAQAVWIGERSNSACYWQAEGWAALMLDILVAEGKARRVYGEAGVIRWAKPITMAV